MQMELGFVQKQLTTLQKQYQDMLEQAGYYQAQHDALQKQPALPATSTSTPPLPELVHITITTKHAKLPDPPVFMGNLQLDDISLDIWKIKMGDKIGQDEACYLNALAQLRYIFLQVGGAAQAQLELYAENDYTKALSNAWQHPDISAYQTMFTILDNVFGDPDQANCYDRGGVAGYLYSQHPPTSRQNCQVRVTTCRDHVICVTWGHVTSEQHEPTRGLACRAHIVSCASHQV